MPLVFVYLLRKTWPPTLLATSQSFALFDGPLDSLSLSRTEGGQLLLRCIYDEDKRHRAGDRSSAILIALTLIQIKEEDRSSAFQHAIARLKQQERQVKCISTRYRALETVRETVRETVYSHCANAYSNHKWWQVKCNSTRYRALEINKGNSSSATQHAIARLSLMNTARCLC